MSGIGQTKADDDDSNFWLNIFVVENSCNYLWIIYLINISVFFFLKNVLCYPETRSTFWRSLITFHLHMHIKIINKSSYRIFDSSMILWTNVLKRIINRHNIKRKYRVRQRHYIHTTKVASFILLEEVLLGGVYLLTHL